MSNTDAQCKPIPLQNSWVRFNPNPKGVAVFIGGYFLGTVPITYNSLLNGLCSKSYTVIFYPYSFTELSHWKIAGQLLEEIESLQENIIKEAQRLGYKTDIYKDFRNYCFVGHSLGCECIALIQFLGLDKDKQNHFLQKAYQDLGRDVVTNDDIFDVQHIPSEKLVPFAASLLMAPCFKSPKLIHLLPCIDIRPKPKLMQYLIEQSALPLWNKPLLPLTALISFKGDDVAGQDVKWLHDNLGSRLVDYNEIQGGFLCPHLIPNFDPIHSGLLDRATKDIDDLIQRQKVGQ